MMVTVTVERRKNMRRKFQNPQLLHFSFARMVRVSVLNDALKSMYNVEKIGKRQVMIRPSVKVITKFLIVMQKHEIEPWMARLLPSRQFGYIVLTTSTGIMDHEEARRKNVGGKVLDFFY
ncbi:hypothetical protein HYC85_028193 [Camellia sinensis]|uniref:30S ribosomal protein S8, chloroplastic n=1 Tax=Camellia sinensis TaxID=4442 RepID=A0A7J7FUL6_CAMSI|nr:hypothetical protein HYC85_028193 [Camellia sinensis]